MAIYYLTKMTLIKMGEKMARLGKRIVRGFVWFFAARGCVFCEHYEAMRAFPFYAEKRTCQLKSMDKKECEHSIARTGFERRK
jgi:hypothetical protein